MKRVYFTVSREVEVPPISDERVAQADARWQAYKAEKNKEKAARAAVRKVEREAERVAALATGIKEQTRCIAQTNWGSRCGNQAWGKFCSHHKWMARYIKNIVWTKEGNSPR